MTYFVGMDTDFLLVLHLLIKVVSHLPLLHHLKLLLNILISCVVGSLAWRTIRCWLVVIHSVFSTLLHRILPWLHIGDKALRFGRRISNTDAWQVMVFSVSINTWTHTLWHTLARCFVHIWRYRLDRHLKLLVLDIGRVLAIFVHNRLASVLQGWAATIHARLWLELANSVLNRWTFPWIQIR